MPHAGTLLGVRQDGPCQSGTIDGGTINGGTINDLGGRRAEGVDEGHRASWWC
ncbi:hypothetical protein [Luteimicrobium xylanilyticum]|uniref:hypothetical protein n=1 Tax=Luteimicrobium xylanilyticum TaxID=1133546 RepID=UPI0004B57713|nr:hypothetical protein [Luteimicrobium xylanilyticum]